MDVRGPFFDLAGAAKYCGYSDPQHFARLMKEHGTVPRRGPCNNRYAASDLDAWMVNPLTFESSPKPRMRKPMELTV